MWFLPKIWPCLYREPGVGGGILCGVIRIGLVAKGLLIKDDMDLELVLMCKEKPTETLLRTVSDNLPLQIQVRTRMRSSTYLFPSPHFNTLTPDTQ